MHVQCTQHGMVGSMQYTCTVYTKSMVGSVQYTCIVYTEGYGRVYTVYMYSVHKEYGRVCNNIHVQCTQKGMVGSIQYT